MIKIGDYNFLKVLRKTDFGVYLDDNNEGILLPKRFVPDGLNVGDQIKVFLYHDSESRIIATTQQPKGIAGDILLLTCLSVTPQGAFMDWGLMKDLFVPKSQQTTQMSAGSEYLVKIYIDQQTGRAAASARIENYLSNDALTLKENDLAELIIYRHTEIGYTVIINNLHSGMLYYNEVFKELKPGDRLQGFIKKIRTDNKIDVAIGKPGFQKVEDEAEKILRLLKENNNFLPYNDKSAPEDIYTFFGMSKKTFKMTTGNLYKKRKINFVKDGIQLLQQ